MGFIPLPALVVIFLILPIFSSAFSSNPFPILSSNLSKFSPKSLAPVVGDEPLTLTLYVLPASKKPDPLIVSFSLTVPLELPLPPAPITVLRKFISPIETDVSELPAVLGLSSVFNLKSISADPFPVTFKAYPSPSLTNLAFTSDLMSPFEFISKENLPPSFCVSSVLILYLPFLKYLV